MFLVDLKPAKPIILRIAAISGSESGSSLAIVGGLEVVLVERLGGFNEEEVGLEVPLVGSLVVAGRVSSMSILSG